MIFPPPNEEKTTEDDDRLTWYMGLVIVLALALIYAYNQGKYDKADEIISYCTKQGTFAKGTQRFSCNPRQEEILYDAS